MEKHRTYDARGLVCPMPILKTAQEIKKIALGQVLEIIADDQGAREDVPAWCDQTGNRYLGMEEQGDMLRFYVQRKV